MIHRKNGLEEKIDKPKRKYLFQGWYARQKHCFDLDIDWVEENISTR